MNSWKPFIIKQGAIKLTMYDLSTPVNAHFIFHNSNSQVIEINFTYLKDNRYPS